MILEHEIPKGSKLYFGKSANLKRDIENSAAQIFNSNGFEEIITPTFSYLQHQDIELNNRELLKLSNEHNFTIVLRNDSTIDVARIINKRLGRSTDHKKWFYIQPVFSYPTSETNQIGAECIDSDDIEGICKLLIEIVKKVGIKPKLQLSNVEIPMLISKECGIDQSVFIEGGLDKLLKSDIPWLVELLHTSDIDGLKKVSVPPFLQESIDKLTRLASSIGYENSIVSPLFFPPMSYYSDLFFRMFEGNSVIALGGKYESEDVKSAGFAIYTDSIVEIFSKNR